MRCNIRPESTLATSVSCTCLTSPPFFPFVSLTPSCHCLLSSNLLYPSSPHPPVHLPDPLSFLARYPLVLPNMHCATSCDQDPTALKRDGGRAPKAQRLISVQRHIRTHGCKHSLPLKPCAFRVIAEWRIYQLVSSVYAGLLNVSFEYTARNLNLGHA